MSTSALLNWRVFSENKPPFDGDFLVVGDGSPAAQPSTPNNIALLSRETPFRRITAIAQHPETKRIVIGTEVASARFAYSDDLGVTWMASNPVSGFTGFCSAIFWISDLGIFLGLTAAGSSHRFLSSTDGITWTRWATVNAGEISQQLSCAYSPTLGIAALGYSELIITFNGLNFSFRRIPGLSVVWDATRLRFFAVQEQTGIIYTSNDGNEWGQMGVMPGDVAGAYLACVGSGDRIIVFCEDTFARYSDDGGLSWAVASGNPENTGSVTRYVAVDSNTLYVAHKAELNLAALSEDNGATWQTSAHRSGYATGIVTLS